MSDKRKTGFLPFVCPLKFGDKVIFNSNKMVGINEVEYYRANLDLFVKASSSITGTRRFQLIKFGAAIGSPVSAS